jgi:hypothetical protein
VADPDNAAELRKLVAVRDRGVLTQSEYQKEEDKVLGPAVEVNDAESGDRRRRRLAERSNFTAVLAFVVRDRVLARRNHSGVPGPKGSQTDGQWRRSSGLVALVIGYLAAMLTIVFIILRA